MFSAYLYKIGRPDSGNYLTVDVPFVGAGATWVEGINNSDQIVGLYEDTAGRVYGYTATYVP